MLEVPEELNRNESRVRAMADPADTGLSLINYMCRRIGIDSLDGLDVLDLGCGVRFSQSIINRKVPVGTYTGLEVNKPIVDFLNENVTDPRLVYHHVNASNQMYNRAGERLDPETPSVLGDQRFDIACMFSVITHQNPQEAEATLRFLRNHVRDDGRLFFSAFIHEADMDFQELEPQNPGLKCSYSLPAMEAMLSRCSWSVLSVVDPLPDDLPIMTSFLCRPI